MTVTTDAMYEPPVRTTDPDDDADRADGTDDLDERMKRLLVPVDGEVERHEASQPATAAVTGQATSKLSRKERRLIEHVAAVDLAIGKVVTRYEFVNERPLPNSIAVASAVSGEGVTTVANGLARTLSQDFGAEVCVINAHTPSLPGTVGIHEVIAGRLPLAQAVVESDTQPGVFDLGLGQAPDDMRRLIVRSSAWTDLVKQLESRFDYCVFDLAPINAAPDQLALARHTRAYLLVARAGATDRDQVRVAAHELRNLPMVGAILNMQRNRTPAFVRRFFT